MIAIESVHTNKTFQAENIFHSDFVNNLPASFIERDTPLNEEKQIKKYLGRLSEAMDNNGILKFFFNHSESGNVKIPFINLFSLMIFPSGIFVRRKKSCTTEKLSEVLYRKDFEIINVIEKNGYHHYTVRKNCLLTI
jgi:hypothetical protein